MTLKSVVAMESLLARVSFCQKPKSKYGLLNMDQRVLIGTDMALILSIFPEIFFIQSFTISVVHLMASLLS